MTGPIPEVHQVKKFHGSFRCFLFSLFRNKCRDANIFEGGKLGKQMMKLKDKPDLSVAKIG